LPIAVPRPDDWQGEEIATLQQIAVQVGIALHQADLVAQLQAAKADLEIQVATRTHALEQANQQLAIQIEDRSRRSPSPSSSGKDFCARCLDSLFTFAGVLTPDGILIEANQAPLEVAGHYPRRRDWPTL
jgi:multidrug efflux pump subunit AcrA (membrane-fusion protein)